MPPKRKRSSDDPADHKAKKRTIGNHCAVPGCTNYAGKTKGTGVSYFKFPWTPPLRQLWIRSIRRGGQWNPDKSHVCSTHFRDTDFERDLKAELMGLKERKILRPGVFPSQNLPPKEGDEDSELENSEDDQKSTTSSSPNDRIIVFQVGSSDESQDASATWDEAINNGFCHLKTQPSGGVILTVNEQNDLASVDGSQPVEVAPNHVVRPTLSSKEEIQPKGDEKTPEETIITFAGGCDQSERLKNEIKKLRLKLQAKEDRMFILEQSSELRAKQQTRIIRELKEENNRLKAELQEKNEKISTLEDALSTDTKLKSIFSPEELEAFLKKAKRWSEL